MSTPRIAIVTGAAGGIGEAIALRLADDGLDVAVNDISSKMDLLGDVVKKLQEKGRRALAVVGDMSNENDVRVVVAKVVEAFGGLDVMVANAGIAVIKPMLETSVEEYDRIMSVNSRSTFLCYKYAAAQMIAQGRGGRIIGACSICGKAGFNDLSAYCASKFAVRALTQTCAIEWAKYQITVNSYAPGIIMTPMVLHPEDDTRGGPASVLKQTIGTPNMPDANPSVIGGLVSYLVRPEAQFITGQCLNINGGVLFD